MTIAALFDPEMGKHPSSGISASVLSPAMRDFWTGMHFLYRYAARCHADVQSIGQQNLRLLNRALKADAHYRRILAEAGRSDTPRGLPLSRKLFMSAEIYAEIFSLRQGESLRLPQHPNLLNLQMVLSGRAVRDGGNGKSPATPRKLPRWFPGPRVLSSQTVRSNDVIWHEPNQSCSSGLTAASNTCVILQVQLPLSYLVQTGGAPRHPTVPRMAAVG